MHTGVPMHVRRRVFLRARSLEELYKLRGLEEHTLDVGAPSYVPRDVGEEWAAMSRLSLAEVNAEINRRSEEYGRNT